eukprot:12735536-Alexandrium_andersonii.AAC.1
MRLYIRRRLSRPPRVPPPFRAPGYAEARGNSFRAPQGRTPVGSMHFADQSSVLNFWLCALVIGVLPRGLPVRWPPCPAVT